MKGEKLVFVLLSLSTLVIFYLIWERNLQADRVSVSYQMEERIPSKQIPSEQMINFPDILLLSSIIKKKTYCFQWVEIGTGSGVETLWLRMNLQKRRRLISYDPINSRKEVVDERIEGTDFVYAHYALMGHINQFARTQVILFHDISHVSSDEIEEIIQALPEYSLIVFKKEIYSNLPAYENTIEPKYWKEIADSYESNYIVLEKIFPKRFVGEFPWATYPEGVTHDQVELRQPTKLITNQDWIVFLRVQKCGTKSLNDIIGKMFPTGNCYPRFLVTPAATALECHLFDLCGPLIAGAMEGNYFHCQKVTEQHCDWLDIANGFFDAFQTYPSDPHIHVVSLLRNPIHRVISEFKHVYKTNPKTWDYCPSNEDEAGPSFSKESFLSFLQNPQNAHGMKNRQTRMVAGCGYKDVCQDIYETEEDMLEEAKRNLLQCDIIGTLENFSDMLLEFSYMYGWKIDGYTTNKGERDLMQLNWDIDDEVQNIILEYNYLDMKLFEFATNVSAFRHKQLQDLVDHPLPKYVCFNQTCDLVQYYD